MPLFNWFRSLSRTPHQSPIRRPGAARVRQLALERLEDRLTPADIPLLNSNPGAAASVYLDFDGHSEASWRGVSNVTIPAYHLDGDPATLTDAEADEIRAMWARVAEDFAPFNINVTTAEPAVLAPGVPATAADGKAVRVSIGGDGMWYQNGSLAGVAQFGSFTNPSYANVCFVFPERVFTFRWVADCITHEVGHTLGLNHQSTFDANGGETAEYNPGTAAWAPLMGANTPDADLSTWHNGTSTSATTVQDELAVLAGATNGFGYRTDDHGNTAATATPLTPGGGVWAGAGVVATAADVDYFSFAVTATDTYRVTAAGPGTDANLDAVVELRSAGGTLLASDSPAGSLAAAVTRVLAPGTYTVAVRSTGQYGRVGSYALTVGAPPAGVIVTPAAPVLTTHENGRAASFAVELATAPAADVIVPVASTNPAEGTASVSRLTFTPANWNVPQTVAVTGVNDAAADGDAAYAVALGTIASTDPEYAGLDPADPAVANVDDDSAGLVYYADSAADTISRARLDGSHPEVLVDLAAAFGAAADFVPSRLVADTAAGRLYWIDTAADAIYRAGLDGSAPERVLDVRALGPSGDSLPLGFAADFAAGKLYWADASATARTIRRANLDGTGVELLLSTAGSPYGIALDAAAGKMYWSELAPGLRSVRRANLDGSGVEVLWAADGSFGADGVELDLAAGTMYWADRVERVVRRANLDGSGVEVVVDARAVAPGSNVYSFTLDAAGGRMYWRTVDAGTIYRANLDGSGVAAVLAGPTLSRLAVVRPAPGVSVTGRAGLVTAEGRTGTSFRVVLTTPPAANVIIPVSSSDTTEGTVSVTTLTFTPTNWYIPQSVMINSVEDTLVDGNVAYTIVLGTTSSTDLTYNGLNPDDAFVTNNDNDYNKFFVVDDASANTTYRYGAPVNSRSSSALNSGNSAPRGAASTVVGDKLWVVDANKKVYVYNASTGALLGSWSAGSLDKSATLEGITVFGNDVWLVDAKLDRVHRYANAASRTSGSQNAASYFQLHADNIGPKDLVTDGTSVWVVDDQNLDRVYKYALSGTYIGRWGIDATNGSPTGITLDPANPEHLWIVDNATDRVYQYNDAVSRTSGSQPASTSYALAAGNANPQGIADPPPVAGEPVAGRSAPVADSMPIATATFPAPVKLTPGSGVTTRPNIGGRPRTTSPASRTVFVSALTFDAAGRVSATGSFYGTADFDPGTGTDSRTAAGPNDADVLKLTSTGAYAWAETFGGDGSDLGWGIAIDPSGFVHLTGRFQGTVDFDPDPTDPFSLTTPGAMSNFYLVKLRQS